MENLDDDIWGDDGAREESEESVCDFIRSDSSYERQLLVEAVLTTPTLSFLDIATHLFVSVLYRKEKFQRPGSLFESSCLIVEATC